MKLVNKIALAALLLGAFLLPRTSSLKGDRDSNLGWIAPKSTAHGIDFNYAWSGKGVGKTRLLNNDWIRTHFGASYVPRTQGAVPSCVAQATATAADFLAVVEVMSGQPERAPPALASAAVIYGLARHEIAGLDGSDGGGAMVLWACQAIQEYGVVASLDYRLLGYDLREPSAVRCLQYGIDGCPDPLEGIAKMHPVHGYVSISSWEQLRDAIATGHPVIVGSNVGFGEGQQTRDKDGFLKRPKHWWFDGYYWNHAMCIIGVCDKGRKGALIINSWGSNWVVGPKRFKSDPDGSFWVDADTIDEMMSQGDSFALVGFKGYPRFLIRR